MSYYILRNEYALPRFLFVAISSWVVAVAFMTIVCVGLWGTQTATHVDILKTLPGPLTVILDICGAYAGIGALCLYVTMWTYWIAVERSSFVIRLGWFLVLLLGLHYGAMIYAYRVWKTGIRRVQGKQPITMNPAAG